MTEHPHTIEGDIECSCHPLVLTVAADGSISRVAGGPLEEPIDTEVAPRPNANTDEGRRIIEGRLNQAWDELIEGAAPRAEGLDVERPMPFVQRVWPPFTNRDQELAQAFREAVAQAHYQAADHPVFPHPLVEDDDYNCPNEWCQRMWAMVREAEDRAGADRGGLDEEIEARAQGGPSVIDVERLGTAMHNIGVTLCDNGGPGTNLDDVAAEYARLSRPSDERDPTTSSRRERNFDQFADKVRNSLSPTGRELYERLTTEAAQGATPRAEGLKREAAGKDSPATPSLDPSEIRDLDMALRYALIDHDLGCRAIGMEPICTCPARGHFDRARATMKRLRLQARLARLDEGSATPDQGKGEPR